MGGRFSLTSGFLPSLFFLPIEGVLPGDKAVLLTHYSHWLPAVAELMAA